MNKLNWKYKMNPFNKVSKTYTGAVVALLGFLAINFGVVTEGEWSQLVALLAQVIGLVGVIWDRYNKGDVNFLGFRK